VAFELLEPWNGAGLNMLGDPVRDLSGDGITSLADRALLLAHFGETYP
jgi:hypothetical protein